MSDRDIASFQKRAQESQSCASADPLSLDMTGLDTEVLLSTPDEMHQTPRAHYQTFSRIIEVRCHQNASKACTDNLQRLDELHEKLEAAEPERRGKPTGTN